MKSTLVSRLKRLEHLESLRRNVAGAPIGAPEYREMIADAGETQTEASKGDGVMI
jgi:hypothetical protein